MEAWFFDFGWPEYIRSDGGPQFRTEFKQFCNKHGIQHELSSPYNPESNGLAEAAVKNLKSLVLRCQANKEDLRCAIATWRNIAREDGISPSQAFFQHKQRQSWPILAEDLQLAPPDMSRKLEKNIKLRNNRDRHTKKFAQLHIGQRVWMQHHQTKHTAPGNRKKTEKIDYENDYHRV